VTDGRRRLVHITLQEDGRIRLSPEIRHERAVAIFDLLAENSFGLVGHDGGPYRLHIAIQESRLVFDVRDAEDRTIERIRLPLTPLRSSIRDYFRICDAYYAAIRTATPSRIEAIDIGRRAAHDEGAAILRERLSSRIDVDETTGRRLFTLICVLHVRDWHR
jgi:uncharacterized protein (UPF0262 family)